MRFPSLYLRWLQKGNPTGKVDRFPKLHDRFKSSVPGIHCCGDLTGIPLIKLASESGHEAVEALHADPAYRREREARTDAAVYDLVIVGAGPAGVAAGLRAGELGYRFVILESSQPFDTIVNFPRGKPIYVTPGEPPMRSGLKFTDGTKETLLDQLHAAIADKSLPIRNRERVQSISREGGALAVKSSAGEYRALRVLLAIGKTGDARRLNVPGEDLPKVFTRLIDPGEHSNRDILVVGGGDSAVEAAVALAEAGNRVTLSYRRRALSRPKDHNLKAFRALVGRGRIRAVYRSSVKEIREGDAILDTPNGELVLPNDAVYALIGAELPLRFFRRCGIRIEGEKRWPDLAACATLLLFSSLLYFGKKAPVTGVASLAEFLSVPARLSSMAAPAMLKGLTAWLSLWGMAAGGLFLAGRMAARRREYFGTPWSSFKYAYYTFCFLFFAAVYISHNLAGRNLLGWGPGIWYTALYSLTIVIFGLRRMYLNPTGYIKRQTTLLMAVQVVPLFILPVLVLPALGSRGLLGSWVSQHVFPDGSYWRAYGFILAWPLFVHNLASHEPIAFWLALSLVQTFVLIPLIVFLWGKGAYCGWICSCGALAETLGDEYRTLAPHGPLPKKMDNTGQVVLWFAALMTLPLLLRTWGGPALPGTDGLFVTYEILVDIFFAGVLGVGVYFFLSGRFWCRFLCPLAALMHIYARFSPYRIMADKKRCISCNICTRVCHMGIDVMGYANRGVPMNDVECVRCSACIVNCPMQVLTFGGVGRIDLDNTVYKHRRFPLPRDWRAGLSRADLAKRLADERHD